jgi:hypothetical protein
MWGYAQTNGHLIADGMITNNNGGANETLLGRFIQRRLVNYRGD